MRVLSARLSPMAVHMARLVVVPTRNELAELPPELVVKGRLVELWCVDRADAEARQMIFSINLKVREVGPEEVALDELVQAAAQFSGAEIEQAIVAALYSARAQDASVTTGLFLNEIHKTSPLSIVMAEKLPALRHWATERKVVPA